MKTQDATMCTSIAYNRISFNFEIPIIRQYKLPLRQPKVAVLKWPIPLADSAELAIF